MSKTMTLSLRLVVLGALWLAYCGGASKLAAKAGLDDEAAVAAAAFKEDTLASNMLPEQEPPHVTKGPGKPAKPTKPPAAKNAPTAAKGPRNECKFAILYKIDHFRFPKNLVEIRLAKIILKINRAFIHAVNFTQLTWL